MASVVRANGDSVATFPISLVEDCSMKTSRGPVLCQGSCSWYWDGTQWKGPTNNCVGVGCGCSANPPQTPPPHTPPFYQFEQCLPAHVQKGRKGKGPCV